MKSLTRRFATVLPAIFIACAACGGGGGGGGDGGGGLQNLSFGAATSLDAGSVPATAQALFAGDLTNDQIVDIAVANTSIGVFVGNGDGTFDPRQDAGINTVSSPRNIANGDFIDPNDLVGVFSTGSIDVFFDPNFDGAYNDGAPEASGTTPEGVAVGDFDGDGDDDIVTCNGDNTIVVNRNDGGAVFVDLTFPSGGKLNNPKNIVAGDFDNDGSIDVAVANGAGDRVVFWKNSGNDADLFPAANASDAMQMPAGSNSQGIAAADLDKDGLLDLVVPSPGTQQVVVFLNAGGGTFDAGVSYGASNDPFSAAVADFNLDGNPDLVVANAFGADFQDGEIGIYLGNGTGTFADAVTFPAGTNSAAVNNNPRSVAVGDFNGDTKPDVVTGNSLGDSISIFLNTSN